jgi:hypothetical protein
LNASGQPLVREPDSISPISCSVEPQSSSLRFGSDNNYFRAGRHPGTRRTTMRLARGLTLNIGLRYEYFPPYTELRASRESDSESRVYFCAVVTPADVRPSSALPSSLVRPDPTAFSPRFGIRVEADAKNNLVVRGGYSIFYSGVAVFADCEQMLAAAVCQDRLLISTSPPIH